MMAPRASSVRARERVMNMTAISMEMEKIDPSARMKEIREVRGFSRDDIADVLCIQRATYNYIERGDTQLKVRHLLKLCKFYNVSPNDFLGWR